VVEEFLRRRSRMSTERADELAELLAPGLTETTGVEAPTPERVIVLAYARATGRDRVLARYVGSFAEYQGVPLLFEALHGALAARAELRFVIVGGGDDPELVREAREGGIGEDSLVHLPFVQPEELPDLLSAMDILVSPRLHGDNTPLKVLDYLKAGRAILATDTEANRLVLDPSTARLAEPTPEGLAAGLADLAGDRDARDELARNGRRKFDEAFGHRRFAESLSGLYGELAREENR